MDIDPLPLRAGPPPTSPPLPIALMIVALGVIGPILFVRVAVPSPLLTIMAILLAIAGVVALLASVDSLRRRRADPLVRTRALIGPDGITLTPHQADPEVYPWSDIYAAFASKSVLMLHLRGDGGKLTRRAIRYGALETPVEMIQGRITVGLAPTPPTRAEP